MKKNLPHSPQEPATALQNAWVTWRKGENQKALHMVRVLFQQWPKDFSVIYAYAQMLGDIAHGQATDEALCMRQESIAILKKLCRNLKGRTPEERWKVRRHYYYFSGQHLKNRALGYEEIARGNKSGILSVGFGCLSHALELLGQGQHRAAFAFAKEAEEAFQKIFTWEPPVYSRHLAYAQALAIQGKAAEAYEATDFAAKLLQKKGDEFTEHNEELKRLLKAAEKERTEGT